MTERGTRVLIDCYENAPRELSASRRRTSSAPHRPLRLLPRRSSSRPSGHADRGSGHRLHTAKETRMSIKTATLNGVATIEIARPEKKNALTVRDVPGDGRRDQCGRRRTPAVRARADHRPARHLHLRQRPRGLHAAPAAERRLAGVPVHAGAGRLRQAGRRRRHRRGDRHRHDDAAALRLRLRQRRSAPGDALRQPRPGARVRLQPAGAAADGRRAAQPRSCCWATRSPAPMRWRCGIANAVLPAGEVREPCAPRRRALQRAAAGRRARHQAADARAAARARAARRSRDEGEVFGERLRSPEAHGGVQAFFQKRKPDFSSSDP